MVAALLFIIIYKPCIHPLQIRQVDSEILDAVRQQSSSGSRARQALQAAKGSISDMLLQVAEIRRKAAQSEVMVQEICRDIKKLDFAKKNLTSTITALRRLAMLINAVDQLQLAVERHEFGEAAHLLGAVQQLSSNFKDYSHVPRVAEMRGRVAALEQSLRLSSLREFELLDETPPTPSLLDRLRDCCAVTAAIGPAARDELVDAVCRREMGVYTQIFGTVGETAKLERTMNRYKWLLRRLEARRDVWAIFPVDWRVPQLLAVTFCSITKTALAEILDDSAAELPHQVDALMKAVEATHIFEMEMARRFEGALATKEDEELEISEAAANIKWRYQSQQAQQGVPSSSSSQKEAKQQHAAAEAVARATFRGSISSVFTPYLGVYVSQVERDLKRSVDTLVTSESWAPLSTDQPILRSSNELTDAVRNEMKECSERVSRGKTLLDLAAAFQRVYCAYASRLQARLPKTATGGTTGVPTLGVSDWQIKLGEGDLEVLCLIVNTAEHCAEMLGQLGRAMATRLEAPLGKDVDFSEGEEQFQLLATQCMSVLILGVETRLEAPLGALIRHNWGAIETAGDQSDYVSTMRSVLVEVGSTVGPLLPPNHFRFFCDKILRSLGPRIREAVLRCRHISDAGMQQLRLDVEALKGVLVALARSGQDAAAAAGEDPLPWVHVFSGDVHGQLGSVEAVLKVASSPTEALVDTFLELLPDASPADFQRIADLKGLKRSELSALLEEFSRRAGTTLVPINGERNSRQKYRPPTALEGSPAAATFRMHPGAKASSAAQDMAARFRLNPNVQAARASAVAASDSMRETMGRTLGAMKSLRFSK